MRTRDHSAGSRSPRWAFMSKLVIRRQPGEDYLTRWRIIQTPLFAVFLHKIDTPDKDEHLHDHPWAFISIVLRGGYKEIFQPSVPSLMCHRTWGRWSAHRVQMGEWHQIVRLISKPTWTLILTGPRREEWGFLVNGRKVNWRVYLGL